MIKIFESSRWRLGIRDLLRATYVAAITAAWPVFTATLDAWQSDTSGFAFDWKPTVITAAKAAGAYLFLNLISRSKIIVTAPSANISEVAQTIKQSV